MDVDGSNLKTLTTDVVSTWAPSFSSDGMEISFDRTVGHRQVPESRLASREVYVVNVNGTGLKRLTKNTAYDSQPTFVPGTDMVRTDPNEQESVVLRPDLEGKVP